MIILKDITKFLLIVVAYYIAAKLGLYMHMPQGQASIIWPAAGIAMGAVSAFGYRYSFAILLGALLSSLQFYDVIDLRAFLIAFGIGAGAALQAITGAFLIQRYTSQHNRMNTVKDISKIMFFAGPVACCVSAVFATSILYFSGIVSSENYIHHIYSWWLGDTFGVLVFTPLVILNFAQSGFVTNISFKRKCLITLPALSVFIICLLLFSQMKNNLESRSYQEFEGQVVELVTEFEKDLTIDFSNLVAIKSFFNSSEYVSAEEYESFTKPLLSNSNGIFGVSWLPKVLLKDRVDFEKSIREQGYPNYSIKNRVDGGGLEVSAERDVYFPLAYTQPYNLNKKAHGFDVYALDKSSKPSRRVILDSARDEGREKATGRLSIVQKEDQYGFVVYMPVYKTAADYNSVKERRANHIGYINGVFVFPQLMEMLNKKAKKLDTAIILQDVTDVGERLLLFDARTQDFKKSDAYNYVFNKEKSVSKIINVGGRLWKITALKETALLPPHYIRQLWYLATLGVCFNALLMMLLMIITARTEIVEELVFQKTQDLQEANAELEEFAYRTSHDLRAPLISTIGLLDLINSMVEEKDYEAVKESTDLAKTSLQKLVSLVQDILSLTQIKGAKEEMSLVIFEDVIKDALNKFGHMDNFDRLEIQTNLEDDIAVHTLPNRLNLIVDNLISNAIKYQDVEKENSYIKISTYKSASEIIFEVEDNGLGIPKESQEKLFHMFERFHPKASYGSGLGLYMMKKSADIINAQVVFEDTGDGSRFKLVMKA